ncbi:MAG: hypothetical protein Kow0068_20310 [Marinilabiliales bacterium]
MKNFLLSAICLLAVAIYANGQSLAFLDMNDNVVSGDTVIVQGDASSLEIVEEFHVKNNGNSALDVKVKKSQIQILSGTSNTFCWAGLCYAPTISVSPYTQNIAAGTATSGATDLSVHYSPNGYTGISIIAYTAFDANNTADSVIVYVIFDATTGINDVAEQKFNGPVPNPANGIVTFTSNVNNENASFNLYNLLGKTIYNKSLKPGYNKITLNVSDLQAGVYVYSYLENDKKVKTGRLIVSH